MLVPCPLCDKSSSRVRFVKKGYTLVQCLSCNLVYVSNRPPKADIRKLYSFESGYHLSFRDDERQCQVHQAIAKDHYQIVKRYKSAGRLLDIGCSAGFFLKVAKEDHWETCGLEISEDTAALARRKYGLTVLTSGLEETGFGPQSFDLVTLWDVIEHLESPRQTLLHIREILTDDGILVLSTPNIDGLFPRLSYKVAKLIGHWPHPEPPRHLCQFSKQTLSHLLRLTGFEPVAVCDGRIPITYTFGSLYNLLTSPGRFLYCAVFAPVAVVGALLHAGDQVTVVARKASERPKTSSPCLMDRAAYPV